MQGGGDSCLGSSRRSTPNLEFYFALDQTELIFVDHQGTLQSLLGYPDFSVGGRRFPFL